MEYFAVAKRQELERSIQFLSRSRLSTSSPSVCLTHCLSQVYLLNLVDQSCSSTAFGHAVRRTDILVMGNVFHDYQSMIEWTAPAVFTDCIMWLSTIDSPVVSYSRAWLFSACKTEQLLCSFLPNQLCEKLRVLAETTTVIHNWGQSAYPSQVRGLRSFAGTQILRALDETLRPASLANSSVDYLAGIFLLLFGTTLAVSYNASSVSSSKVGFLSEVGNRSTDPSIALGRLDGLPSETV